MSASGSEPARDVSAIGGDGDSGAFVPGSQSPSGSGGPPGAGRAFGWRAPGPGESGQNFYAMFASAHARSGAGGSPGGGGGDGSGAGRSPRGERNPFSSRAREVVVHAPDRGGRFTAADVWPGWSPEGHGSGSGGASAKPEPAAAVASRDAAESKRAPASHRSPSRVGDVGPDVVELKAPPHGSGPRVPSAAASSGPEAGRDRPSVESKPAPKPGEGPAPVTDRAPGDAGVKAGSGAAKNPSAPLQTVSAAFMAADRASARNAEAKPASGVAQESKAKAEASAGTSADSVARKAGGGEVSVLAGTQVNAVPGASQGAAGQSGSGEVKGARAAVAPNPGVKGASEAIVVRLPGRPGSARSGPQHEATSVAGGAIAAGGVERKAALVPKGASHLAAGPLNAGVARPPAGQFIAPAAAAGVRPGAGQYVIQMPNAGAWLNAGVVVGKAPAAATRPAASPGQAVPQRATAGPKPAVGPASATARPAQGPVAPQAAAAVAGPNAGPAVTKAPAPEVRATQGQAVAQAPAASGSVRGPAPGVVEKMPVAGAGKAHAQGQAPASASPAGASVAAPSGCDVSGAGAEKKPQPVPRTSTSQGGTASVGVGHVPQPFGSPSGAGLSDGSQGSQQSQGIASEPSSSDGRLVSEPSVGDAAERVFGAEPASQPGVPEGGVQGFAAKLDARVDRDGTGRSAPPRGLRGDGLRGPLYEELQKRRAANQGFSSVSADSNAARAATPSERSAVANPPAPVKAECPAPTPATKPDPAPTTTPPFKSERKAWPGPFSGNAGNTGSDSDFSFSFSSEPGSCLEPLREDAAPDDFLFDRPSQSPAIKRLLSLWDTIHGPNEFIA